MFNRRNAAFGWLAWKIAKRALKKKASDAVPSVDSESRKPNKSAIALLIAGAVGVAAFWRARSGDDDYHS